VVVNPKISRTAKPDVLCNRRIPYRAFASCGRDDGSEYGTVITAARLCWVRKNKSQSSIREPRQGCLPVGATQVRRRRFGGSGQQKQTIARPCRAQLRSCLSVNSAGSDFLEASQVFFWRPRKSKVRDVGLWDRNHRPSGIEIILAFGAST
jgi:hypothetical protein